MDTTYWWHWHEEFVTGDYWVQRRGDTPGNYNVEEMPLAARDTLNTQQRQVYDTVMRHFRVTVLDCRPPPLRLQIDGGGGTGKSYMVKVISSHLQAKAASYGRISPIVRAAPTGVASNQIGGQTLHSLLRLPIDGNYRSLSETPTALNALQRRFRGIHYLVIDEKSMLGLKTLAWIDQRLREVFPENRDEFFGGLGVILIGDFFQLPPVLNKPLYSTGEDLKDIEMVGRNAYLSFEKSVFLTKI
jgi:hypothetical protein